MTAYVVAEVAIKDHTRYENEYLPIIKKAHVEFGGRLMARTDQPATFAGHAARRPRRADRISRHRCGLAVVEWPHHTMKQAHDTGVVRIHSIFVIEGIET